MEQTNMRCVLVSCCGLPAAGKTTFCRRVVADPAAMPAPSWASSAAPATPAGAQMRKLGANREGNARVRVSHVCFDEYIKLARRRCPSSSENSSPSGPRGNYDQALGTEDESVERNRVTEMTPRAGLAAEDSARLWHEGRRAALAEIEALASTQNTNDSTMAMPTVASAVEASHSATERKESSLSGEVSATHVVLVDDNMHFRTMRREVFSLARKYGCGYAQAYFPLDVELAVERNETRGTPVTEAVIRKMAENLQPPDPMRFKWERHTAVVWGTGDRSSRDPSGRRSGNGLRTSGDAEQEEDGAGKEWGDWNGSGAQQSFWRIITAAAEDLLVTFSPAVSLLQQEADRDATRGSLLHQFDLELRESVKRVAKRAADARLPSDVLREVMQACSASRKNAMRRAKAAGYQSRAREASRSDTNQKKGGRGAGRGGTPVPSTGIPLLEHFVLEFEEVVSNVEGIEVPVRQSLVNAARVLA